MTGQTTMFYCGLATWCTLRGLSWVMRAVKNANGAYTTYADDLKSMWLRMVHWNYFINLVVPHVGNGFGFPECMKSFWVFPKPGLFNPSKGFRSGFCHLAGAPFARGVIAELHRFG